MIRPLTVLLFGSLQAESYYSAASRCAIPARQRLDTDVTDGALPALDNALCFLVPWLKDISSDRVAFGVSRARHTFMPSCKTGIADA